MKQMLEIFEDELPDVVIGSYTHVPPQDIARQKRLIELCKQSMDCNRRNCRAIISGVVHYNSGSA